MTLTKKQLLAIDNVAILMRAKDRGLKLHPEDLRINYAEMDLALNSLEDNWQQLSTVIMSRRFKKWLSDVKKPEDLDQEGMGLGLHLLILDFIQSIWDYGQRSADAEAQSLEQSFAEGSGGKPGLTDLTNSDAFEWYDLYTRELAKHTEKAVFHYMQPLILEKLDQGKVGLELAAALEEDFRRFGQVRTQIIARTESNKAFNWGRRYRFDKSQAIAGYRYSAVMDERTTEICETLHGHSWEINDPGLDVHTPPNHYQCRSVLVPISKYRSFDFDPPPSGWESGLPKKEREVFEKFKDSTFYPKAETVKKMDPPKMDPPKKKAAPKQKAGKYLSDVDWREMDSLEDIQRAFKNMYDFDFEGMDLYELDTVKGIAGKVEKVFKTYPELQGFAKRIKGNTRKEENTYAFVINGRNNGAVHVVDHKWAGSNVKRTRTEVRDARRSGWFVRGEGLDEYSIFTHEYGHVMANYLETVSWYKYVKTNELDVVKYIKRKALSKGKYKAGDVKRSLSQYATYNLDEFFAEAFEEYMDSDSPRGLAKAFGEVLEELLEAIRKGLMKK